MCQYFTKYFLYIDIIIIILLPHPVQRSCNKPQLNWLHIFQDMIQNVNVAAVSFWHCFA